MLTNLSSGGVHLSTANGGETTEENVQFVGCHMAGKISAEYLSYHSKKHYILGTKTKYIIF